LRRRPSWSMRCDLPTREAYPRNTLSRPRCSRRSSACKRSRSSSGLGLRSVGTVTSSTILFARGGGLIEIKVQQKNVDTRFSKKAPLATFGVFDDQLGNELRRHTATSGYPGNLSFRRSGTDVGIKAAARGSQEVGGNRTGKTRVLGPKLFDVGL